MRALYLIIFSVSCAVCEPMYSITGTGTIQVARAEYHTYENAWTVHLSKEQQFANEIVIIEMCQPPCPETVSFLDPLIDCTALTSLLNDTAWYNDYTASHVHDFPSFCNSLSTNSAFLQLSVGRILDESQNVSLVRLRPPLELVLFNEEALLSTWSTQVNADTVRFSVRVIQIAPLQSVFFVHVSLISLQVSRPAETILTLALQNPCTAVGLSAPTHASVQSVKVYGNYRCMWNCRADMLRKPYNSAPATREAIITQMNASNSSAQIYECLKLPVEWTAIIFELKLRVSTFTTESSYSQSVYDALDAYAAATQRNLSRIRGGTTVVAMGIKNSLYHPHSFEEVLRKLLDSTCMISTCGKMTELVNPHFFYHRRRLLDVPQQVTQLLVEGSYISTDNLPYSHLLNDLRGTLAETRETAVMFTSVEDIDFAKVLYVKMESPPLHTPAPSDDPPKHVQTSVPFVTTLAVFMIVMIVAAIMCTGSVNSH
jgi:hypothetical protein